MIAEIRKLATSVSDRFARRFYASTFPCPVCHFVLAAVDADGNGLLVCPVCGVVLEIESVYGHIVPVVQDVEIFRPQPWARLHPLATHLPIGLFPFALLGAGVLFIASLLHGSGLSVALEGIARQAPLLANATLALLALSVGFSPVTFASGVWDWSRRYRRRPYRQITLKIVFAAIFLGVGAGAIALHLSGLVFPAGGGLMLLGTPLGLAATLLYLLALLVAMVVLATLGHVGGTLVFGR